MSSPVFRFEPSDLAGASEAARRSFKFFWRELSWEQRRIVPGFDMKMVKLAFEEHGKFEHMWVADVDFDGETIRGVLLNEPHELGNVHEGDAVEVPFGERFDDWMLTSSGKVLGAFTVNAMRASMAKKERAQHDKAWGLDFGDPASVSVPPDGDDHPMCINMQPGLKKYLAEHPEALTTLDERGFTLLHSEALAGNAASVETLLAHGANARAKTKAGKTPLDLAKILGWPKVEAALGAP